MRGVAPLRKLVAYELLSLDGVAEEPLDFITDFDDVMIDNLGRVIATQDTVLLGRRTYDQWAAFWPNSEIQPFSSFINNVEKFVVTATPPEEQWANSSVAAGGLVEFVMDLKRQPGQDIGLHGSIELAQGLLKADLVDELRLVIAPAIQITGRKLFEATSATRLTLARTITSPTGYLLLDYETSG
jgi:dihydrofolate reductase